MRNLFVYLFEYSKLKLSFVILLITVSIVIFVLLFFGNRYEKIDAIDMYVHALQHRLSDEGYEHLISGRNYKFFESFRLNKVNYQFGKISLDSEKVIFKFVPGGVVYLGMTEFGTERTFGLKPSNLEFKMTDIFENGSHFLRFETIECHPDYLFDINRFCIDKTYKIR